MEEKKNKKKERMKELKLHFVKVLTTLELCNLVGLKLFTCERKKKQTNKKKQTKK